MDDAVSEPSLPRPGDVVDRYRVVAPIARGGMAAVYAVQRTAVGGFEKLLAMKVMLPHLVGERNFVDMFLDEARIASRIHHPNVVQVFDVGELAGVPFLIMELLRGQTLARVVQRAEERSIDLPATFWLAILSQAAEGLHAAHETKGSDGAPLGVVHRDVSPQNVLVGYGGEVKVVDFGIAAARGRLSGTRTGEIKGKFAYLAPEQVGPNRSVTRLADVWALGVVAWEIFARRRLFAAPDDATVLWNLMNTRVPDLRKEAPRLPEDAARAIMACLVRDPAQRTPTARELARALATASAALGPDSLPDLSEPMRQMFAAEQDAEGERLHGAIQVVDSAPITAPSRGASPTRRTARAGVAVAAIAVAAAGALWFVAGASRGSVSPEPAAGAPPRGSPEVFPTSAPTYAPAMEPENAERTIRVRIPPEVRLVLVEGKRHDERPVEVTLPTGDGSAAVEMVAPDGQIIRRDVTAADEGALLALPAPVPPSSGPAHRPRPAAAPRVPGSAAVPAAVPPPPKSTSPLMPDPFGS